MTDVLDRLDQPVLDTVVADDVDHVTDRPARTALAAVSAAAALIHVAMGPGHLGEDAIVGGGMIAAAWLQVAAAWLALARPGRRVWVGAIVLNVALLGSWAVSRTAGLPFGAHEGEAESMTIVDLTCVALEVAALVLAARLLLLRPSSSRITARALAFGVPVLVVVAATTALASPDARDHGGAGHGAAAHDDDAHAATPAMAGLQERGFGSFMNGHEHSHVEVVLDPGTQAELDRQLAITAEVAAQHPTLQDAIDAGYTRVGPYVPGLGVHMAQFGGAEFLNPDGIMSDDDLRHPLSLLYTSTEPDAEIGGLMYYAATALEPEGFPGRNDGWHFHEDLCMVRGADGRIDFPFGPDFGATKAQCDTVDGVLFDSQWMVHVWTAPGWDDMSDYGGVFAEMHPKFGCSDDTWFSLPFEQWDENPLNTCVSGASGQPAL